MGDARSRTPGREETRARRAPAWASFAWLAALACVPAPTRGQDPPPELPPPAAEAPAAEAPPAQAAPEEPPSGEAQPLSLWYHFTERYVAAASPAHPAWLSQYQVGVREKIKFSQERAEGAPESNEVTLQTIYTERAVKTTPTNAASDVVRRYERAQLSTTLKGHRPFQNPKFLEQLMLWYRVRPGQPVELYNLSDGRKLRQLEFDRITSNPFLPQLATLLPGTPRRVGDPWPVPRTSLAVLLGEMPLEDEYQVEARLIDVRASAPGSASMTAVFGIQGRALLESGDVALNVRVNFTFDAPAAKPAAGQPKARPAVEAEGWISEIRMAETVTSLLPGDETGRLNQIRSRELVLARRARASEMGPEAALPLIAPDAPPDDPTHTWVTYDDPQGRFHLEHPQGLRIQRITPDGGVDLVDRRFEGSDVVSLSLVPKTGDAAEDKLAADPLEHKKKLVRTWREQGQEILMGDSGWLKEAVWGPLNRRVYRLEAALKPAGDQGAVRSGRIYADYYVVQFTRDETLVVTAMTVRDPHVAFRDQAEGIIKSFTFGPSEAPVGAAPPAGP
ncbi:MAG: hypothetical protein BGO49_27775 [Planctomycetales bacterium 71-10]|nr:MAG: hypothetical protein BGO49_27775 [Planctomycetales bacterium 71-10]